MSDNSFEHRQLNRREREVVTLLVHGLCNKEIAEHMKISVDTVKTHLRNISLKLGVNGRGLIVARMIESFGRRQIGMATEYNERELSMSARQG